MVFIGETAARPAQRGELYLPERVYNVLAVALDIRYRAVLSDIYAVINAASQVFREIGINFLVDPAPLIERVYCEL